MTDFPHFFDLGAAPVMWHFVLTRKTNCLTSPAAPAITARMRRRLLIRWSARRARAS